MTAVPEAELPPFLDTILADPDADEPQLVLANFLEERGDERGQWLREGVAWMRRIRALPALAEAAGGVSLDGLGERRLRLFAVACVRLLPVGARRLPEFFQDRRRGRQALAAAELHAHGLLSGWRLAGIPRSGSPAPGDGAAAATLREPFSAEAARSAAWYAGQVPAGLYGSGGAEAARRWQAAVAALARELSPRIDPMGGGKSWQM
jgi:uncharacterized protein (TIGR02996 family)